MFNKSFDYSWIFTKRINPRKTHTNNHKHLHWVLLAVITSYYKLIGLQQCPFIISKFCRSWSKVSFSAPRPKSRCQPPEFLEDYWPLEALSVSLDVKAHIVCCLRFSPTSITSIHEALPSAWDRKGRDKMGPQFYGFLCNLNLKLTRNRILKTASYSLLLTSSSEENKLYKKIL